jgi:hypothetical protein
MLLLFIVFYLLNDYKKQWYRPAAQHSGGNSGEAMGRAINDIIFLFFKKIMLSLF